MKHMKLVMYTLALLTIILHSCELSFLINNKNDDTAALESTGSEGELLFKSDTTSDAQKVFSQGDVANNYLFTYKLAEASDTKNITGTIRITALKTEESTETTAENNSAGDVEYYNKAATIDLFTQGSNTIVGMGLHSDFDYNAIPAGVTLTISAKLKKSDAVLATGIIQAKKAATVSEEGIDYILIYNWRDLQNMEQKLDGKYQLQDDIDFPKVGEYGFERFTPIGDDTNKFTGVLEGNGKSIRGLYIDMNRDYVGMFGYIDNAKISNFTILHLGIKGSNYVGVLAGRANSSTIENIGIASKDDKAVVSGIDNVGGLLGYTYNSIKISGYVKSAVSGEDDVGGLVGRINASTVNGYVTGSVSGTNNVGGLAGYIYSSIDNASTITGYSTGTVTGIDNIGGIVGWEFNSTVRGYARGNVSGSHYVGGAVGQAAKGTVNVYVRNQVIRKKSDSDTTMSDFFGLQVGGIESHDGLISLEGYYSSSESKFSDGINSILDKAYHGKPIHMQKTDSATSKAYFEGYFDFAAEGSWIWVEDGKWPAIKLDIQKATEQPIDSGEDATFCNSSLPPKNGSNEYELNSEADLKLIKNCLSGHFILTSDIILNNAWEPLGSTLLPFIGELDGGNYTISGLQITSTNDLVGLFASMDTAKISNLVIDHKGISGGKYVGALAGYATNSTIKNVGVKSTNQAIVSGFEEVGGIVGHAKKGSISGYMTGAVSGKDNVETTTINESGDIGGMVGNISGSGTLSGYTTGAVDGLYAVGGLVGKLDGTVSGYSTGNVSGYQLVGGLVGAVSGLGTIKGYSTGNIKGVINSAVDSTNTSNSIGGLVGYLYQGTVDGYATGKVEGSKYVAGLIGKIYTYATVSGYFRNKIVRSGEDNTNKSFAMLANLSYFTRITVKGHYSYTESAFSGISEEDAEDTDDVIGNNGIPIEMRNATPITTKDAFTNLDFTSGVWQWIGDGKWPAIDIGTVKIVTEQPITPADIAP